MQISFLEAASGPVVAPHIALEPKVCECCRSHFYRPVQVALAPGPKYCHRCAPRAGLPLKKAPRTNERHTKRWVQ